VLPFYLAYRALVRAKIALLRAAQLDAGAAGGAALAESRGYLRLARRYAEPRRPALIITCGLSGSGKTALSQALLETIGAVRVRSDVERKRLHGVAATARSEADIAQGLYSPAASEATYDRLRALARDILAAGSIAIVDATFLRQADRESFRMLARDLAVPFVIRRLRSEGGDAARAHHPTSRRGLRCVRRRSRGPRAPDRDTRASDGRREGRTPSPTTPKRRSKRQDAVRLGAGRGPAGRSCGSIVRPPERAMTERSAP
jgi:predicted kinase